MVMRKVIEGNTPEVVSIQAEYLSYQVTNAGREKHPGGSGICKRKQVKYMGDSSKEID